MKTLMKNSLLSPWRSGLRTEKNGYRTGTQAGKKCFHYGTPPQHFNFKFFGPWTSMPRHFFFFFRSWFPSRLGFVEFSDDKKCFSMKEKTFLCLSVKDFCMNTLKNNFLKRNIFQKSWISCHVFSWLLHTNFQSIFCMIMCQNYKYI